MGSGKNFIGNKISELTGLPFIDGDSFLPESLLKKVENAELIFASEIDLFLRQNLLPGLVELSKQFPDGVIVEQALYGESHRNLIASQLNCDFFWIKTPFKQHLRNLSYRSNSGKWIINMLLSKMAFNKPILPHKIIVNSDNLLKLDEQLKRHFLK